MFPNNKLQAPFKDTVIINRFHRDSIVFYKFFVKTMTFLSAGEKYKNSSPAIPS
jgi:hypothetical protein